MKSIILSITLLTLNSSTLFAQIINDYQPVKEISKSVSDTIFIDPLSTIPVYLETIKNISGKNNKTGSASGFVLEEKAKFYLITNWHVVTSRKPADSSANKIPVKNRLGKTIEIDISDPEKLRVFFHGKKLGTWKPIELELYDSGKKVWLEHPLGRKVDVVAIPLNLTPLQKNEINLNSLNYKDYDIKMFPSLNLSIIGFPFGFSSFGRFPIWKTGQLASDFDINFDNLPVFLIDAATRGGMSGSPVIIRQTGTSVTNSGLQVGGQSQKFLGVYSGRLPNDSDIGIVWKIECLKEIIK